VVEGPPAGKQVLPRSPGGRGGDTANGPGRGPEPFAKSAPSLAPRDSKESLGRCRGAAGRSEGVSLGGRRPAAPERRVALGGTLVRSRRDPFLWAVASDCNGLRRCEPASTVWRAAATVSAPSRPRSGTSTQRSKWSNPDARPHFPEQPTNPTTKVVSDGLFIDFPRKPSRTGPKGPQARSGPRRRRRGGVPSHQPGWTEPQQVGGRRRFRPEFVLMLAGSFFLVAHFSSLSSALPARSPANRPIFGPTDPASVAPAGPVAEAKTPRPRLAVPVGLPDVPRGTTAGLSPARASRKPARGSPPTRAGRQWTGPCLVAWIHTTAGDMERPACRTWPIAGKCHGAVAGHDLVPAGAPRYTTINVSTGARSSDLPSLASRLEVRA